VTGLDAPKVDDDLQEEHVWKLKHISLHQEYYQPRLSYPDTDLIQCHPNGSPQPIFPVVGNILATRTLDIKLRQTSSD